MHIYIISIFCNEKKDSAIGQSADFPISFKFKIAGKNSIRYDITPINRFVACAVGNVKFQGIPVNNPGRTRFFFSVRMPSVFVFSVKK